MLRIPFQSTHATKNLLTPASCRPWPFAPSVGLTSKTQQLRHAATYSAKNASKKDGHPDHESVRTATSPLAQTTTCTLPSDTKRIFPPHLPFSFFPIFIQTNFLHLFYPRRLSGLVHWLKQKKYASFPPPHFTGSAGGNPNCT